MTRNRPKEITGDEETDAILSEMEKEGEALPAFADAPADTEETEESETEEEAEETETTEAEEETDEEPVEDESEEETTEAEEADDETEDEEEEGDEESEDEESDEEDETNSKLPLWKRLKITKKKLADTNALLDTLRKTTTEADLDAKVEALSLKHKVSKEAAKEMIEIAAEIAAQKAGIDPALKATIDSVVKRDKQHKFWASQEKQYTKDFASNVAPLAQRDGLDPKEVQNRLQGLAFKPENVNKSLVALYLEAFPAEKGPKRKITSEGNRAHGRVAATSADDLNPEDIENMSDEEFDDFSEAAGKASKSRIVRH